MVEHQRKVGRIHGLVKAKRGKFVVQQPFDAGVLSTPTGLEDQHETLGYFVLRHLTLCLLVVIQQ